MLMPGRTTHQGGLQLVLVSLVWWWRRRGCHRVAPVLWARMAAMVAVANLRLLQVVLCGCVRTKQHDCRAPCG